MRTIHDPRGHGGDRGYSGFCLIPLSLGHAPIMKCRGRGGGVLPYFGHFLCPHRQWMALNRWYDEYFGLRLHKLTGTTFYHAHNYFGKVYVGLTKTQYKVKIESQKV